MIIIFIIEYLTLPNVSDYRKPSKFYSAAVEALLEDGGVCYFGGKDLAGISCKKFPFSEIVENILSIPIGYILMFFLFLPFGTLDKLIRKGVSLASEEILLYILFILWILIIISIMYYIVKRIINIIIKFKNKIPKRKK